MTNWTPEVHVVGVGCAHVYLVPDNGSLSRVHTVDWNWDDPMTRDRTGRTVHALEQLFRQVGVVPPDNLHDLATRLWARLDRRKPPPPPV